MCPKNQESEVAITLHASPVTQQNSTRNLNTVDTENRDIQYAQPEKAITNQTLCFQ